MTVQYARSTDPEVLATMERNQVGYAEASRRIYDWIEQFGTEAFYPNNGFPSGRPMIGVRAVALDEKPVGHGQWAVGAGGYGFRPAKNNPLYAEMCALSWVGEDVPGLTEQFKADDPQNFGRWYMLDPKPFFALGAAWVMLSRLPTSGEFGPQWTEVKASEAYAARESLS